MSNNTKSNKKEADNNRFRFRLTWIIVGSGLLILLVLASLAIWAAWEAEEIEDRIETAKWIFNATIPLIASWIGTVIAFYFGRDNFEAATQSVLALSKDTLDDLAVENMMIHTKTIVDKKVEVGKEDALKLKPTLQLYKDINKDRIPVFSMDYKPLYIIHLSTIQDFLAQADTSDGNAPQTNAGQPPANPDSGPSLKDLLKKEEFKKKFGPNEEKGFVTLKRSDTVQEAKSKMDKLKNCRNAFITEDGTENTEVLGWLTDTLISRFLNVESK